MNKIGYPDKWRDYSKLEIVRGDALGNQLRVRQFNFARELSKIGKPVDKGEWMMSPPTVNAYYDPQQNNVNFPAGYFQPPFFSDKEDNAANYGDMGSTVGHELTHGFDDEGRQYDKDGNLKDWWTKDDEKKFTERADCMVRQFDAIEAVPGVHLNGKLTLGENTADNGGIRLAFAALMETLDGKQVEPIDGFTPEQRFFLGYARGWCGKRTEAFERMLAQVDPHSPENFRVNGVLENMPEFQKAFACKVGQPMVAAPACRVW
jgi:endothelin-converting enzyme/putative endopeptidase